MPFFDTQSRDQLRDVYIEAWRKRREGLPMEPLEAQVADVIELPLANLADRSRRGQHEIVRGPLRFHTPHLQVAGRNVWGATWIILGELLERLESLGPIA